MDFKGVHLVGWSKHTKPKEKEGLGITRLKDTKFTLLFR